MDYKLISDPRTKNFKLVKIGSGLKKFNLLYGMWIFRPEQLDVIWISFGVSIENICISLFTFQGFGEVGWVRWEWEWEWDVGIHRLDGVFLGGDLHIDCLIVRQLFVLFEF